MDRMTEDVYDAVKHGYLPAPERLRGERGRWEWHWPERFQEMQDFYRKLKSYGYRGDALHFAMWMQFGFWHDGAKEYVVHITAHFAKAMSLLAEKQKQVTPGDVRWMIQLMALSRRVDMGVFHPNPFDGCVKDVLDEMLGVLASGEPLDEKSKNFAANWLFDSPYREKAVRSDTFSQAHKLIDVLAQAAQTTSRHDYERARYGVADVLNTWCTKPITPSGETFFSMLASVFSTWLHSLRSTEGRILRPLKRAPSLALVALLLADRLSLLVAGEQGGDRFQNV